MPSQGGLVFLRETVGRLPISEQRIAEFVLKNPQKVAAMNITELADASGGSAAGVVRLCKRVGVTGFADLKLRVALDVSREKEQTRPSAISSGQSVEQIARFVLANQRRTIDDIQSMLDTDALSDAASAILAARRIDIYGLGASGIVAHDFYQKLLRIGLVCSHEADSHLQITSACGLSKKDVAFAISYSGETREIIAAATHARRSGARIICLTRFGDSSITRLSHIRLFVPSTEPLLREAAMGSRIAQLTVIDILFSTMCARGREGFLRQLKRTREALRRT